MIGAWLKSKIKGIPLEFKLFSTILTEKLQDLRHLKRLAWLRVILILLFILAILEPRFLKIFAILSPVLYSLGTAVLYIRESVAINHKSTPIGKIIVAILGSLVFILVGSLLSYVFLLFPDGFLKFWGGSILAILNIWSLWHLIMWSSLLFFVGTYFTIGLPLVIIPVGLFCRILFPKDYCPECGEKLETIGVGDPHPVGSVETFYEYDSYAKVCPHCCF